MKLFKNKRTKRPSRQELQQLIKEYRSRTAEITDEIAMEMLRTDKTDDFLMLLNIARYVRKGKPHAILTAFKLGFLEGRAAHEPDEGKMQVQDTASEVSVKLQKASTVLKAVIENYGLGSRNPTPENLMSVISSMTSICNMVIIASDYLYYAQKELESLE